MHHFFFGIYNDHLARKQTALYFSNSKALIIIIKQQQLKSIVVRRETLLFLWQTLSRNHYLYYYNNAKNRLYARVFIFLLKKMHHNTSLSDLSPEMYLVLKSIFNLILFINQLTLVLVGKRVSLFPAYSVTHV